jgi:hypothetical protein
MKLPFTEEEFFRVFAAYNDSFWVFAALLWVLTAVTFVLAIRIPARMNHSVGLLLALHWAWSAVAYHFTFFSAINPAAYLFAALFLIQAGLLIWIGVVRNRLQLERGKTGRDFLGYALVTYALVYPLVGVPSFGIPCPSTILTIGFLFAANPGFPGTLAVIPIIWSVIGGSATALMGVWADAVLLFAGICLAVYVTVGRSFSRRVSRDITDLFATADASVGPQELQARWSTLPDPVRLYLRYAIRDGTPGLKTVRLEHGGTFRTKPGRWFSIRGRQYFTAARPGFVWHAVIRPIPLTWIAARDCLIGGRGNMLVKLWSVFTIADASGPEIDQGSRLRWLAECPWFPYAFVGNQIEWEAIDARSARAKLRCNGVPVEAVFEFDDEGKLRRVRAERYRDIGGGKAALTRWDGEYSDYRKFGGFRLPASVDVSWELETGKFSYAHFEIETPDYECRPYGAVLDCG